MKLHLLKAGLASVLSVSSLFFVVVVFAETFDQSTGQFQAGRTETPPPLPDIQGGMIPPSNFSGGEGSTMPPPPNSSFQTQGQNNFRAPQNEQLNREGQAGFQRSPKESQQGGTANQSGKDFQGDRVGNSVRPPKPSMTQGGNDNFGQDNGGDWEAQQQKMEAEQQKREEAMVKKQAVQMAKMLQQNVTAINKRVAKLKGAGIALTVECGETIATLTDAIAKVKSATTREGLEDAQDAMQSMEDVGACRQIIDRLINAPKMLKNAASTLKSLKKRKVDISEIEPKLVALTEHFNKFKSGSTTNDDVEAFFDEADELGDQVAPLLEGKKNAMQGASVFESVGFFETIRSWFGL